MFCLIFAESEPTVTSRIVDAQKSFWSTVALKALKAGIVFFFKKEPPLVNLLGTQGWLTDRQKRPKNRLWNYFCYFSSLAIMRCVAFWRTLPQVKFQSQWVETAAILWCWLLLFIQPLLIRLIAQCRRSPHHHHHLPNAPWRYLPKDNHATFETCKKNPPSLRKYLKGAAARRCAINHIIPKAA